MEAVVGVDVVVFAIDVGSFPAVVAPAVVEAVVVADVVAVAVSVVSIV